MESFWAQNPEKFGSGNGANRCSDYGLKPVFFQKNDFNQEKTVQFRRVRICAKI